MGFIDIVGLFFLAVSAYVFLSLTTTTESVKLDSFFFNSHATKSRRYGASVAAASTSLATVIVFFITGVEQYGVFLIWCGITYFLGQYSVIIVLKKSKIQTAKLTTIADFWLSFSSGKISSRLISGLTIMAFLFMLFLELFIGSQILTYYLQDYSFTLSLICFLSLLLIVAVYVFRGGMFAVFKSDLWQYTLMLISIITIGFVSIVYVLSLNDASPEWARIYEIKDAPELSLFLIWVTIQNLTLPYTQLSSWQRLASSESVDSAMIGLKSISKGFLALWVLPVLSMLLLQVYGVQFTDIAEFFDFLRQSNQLVIYLSFAIIFVGFASALFSTADSALMACALSVSDRSTFRNYLEKRSFNESKKLILVFIFLLIILEVALFIIFSQQALQSFLSVVYVIFSQLSLIFPLISYALYFKIMHNKDIALTNTQDYLISSGLFFGWLSLFYFIFLELTII